MDDNHILDIYNNLTRKRKEVINRMLVGHNKTQIAQKVPSQIYILRYTKNLTNI